MLGKPDDVTVVVASYKYGHLAAHCIESLLSQTRLPDRVLFVDDGVGDLIKIASEKGKKQNKSIKLGICGEHGGDPKSIHLCSKIGLNYVSCSPYRVPIARLAAAQAELKK